MQWTVDVDFERNDQRHPKGGTTGPGFRSCFGQVVGLSVSGEGLESREDAAVWYVP